MLYVDRQSSHEITVRGKRTSTYIGFCGRRGHPVCPEAEVLFAILRSSLILPRPRASLSSRASWLKCRAKPPGTTQQAKTVILAGRPERRRANSMPWSFRVAQALHKAPGAPEPTREVSPRVWGRFAKNRAKSAPPQRVALIALAHRHLRTAVRERDAAHMPLPASAK